MPDNTPQHSLKPGSPVIEAEPLCDKLGDSNLVIIDVRGRFNSPPVALRNDYVNSHIPGAHFLDWTQHFVQQDVRPGLAAVATFDQARIAFETLGINDHSEVVIYDDYHHMFAGRIWWAMRYWGFNSVSVLNGGWQYWKQQQFPTSSDIPDCGSGNFVPVEQPLLRLSMDQFLIRREADCVIDARGPISYAGSIDDERSGHIPGAINVPFSRLLDENTGRFRDVRALGTVMDAHVPDWLSKTLIPSCGSGYSATVLMLALEQLGVPTPLFDDSFAGWKEDTTRPVEQGAM